MCVSLSKEGHKNGQDFIRMKFKRSLMEKEKIKLGSLWLLMMGQGACSCDY